jgi:hypothetical protein
VALPFRILYLIAKLFEISLAQRTGHPLLPPNAAAQKSIKTPPSWLLMRQPPAASEKAETIAEGALAFDLAADGSVIYSNGPSVYRIPPAGAPAKILEASGIDLIAAL